VLRHAGHGQRVQGLQQQCRQPAEQHRRVAVDPPGGAARAEQAGVAGRIGVLLEGQALRRQRPGERRHELMAEGAADDRQVAQGGQRDHPGLQFGERVQSRWRHLDRCQGHMARD
jgi:hypothetical protein